MTETHIVLCDILFHYLKYSRLGVSFFKTALLRFTCIEVILACRRDCINFKMYTDIVIEIKTECYIYSCKSFSLTISAIEFPVD